MSHARLFVTPWTAALQAFLSFTISRSLLKLMCIESVINHVIHPSNHLILCCPFLLPSVYILWFRFSTFTYISLVSIFKVLIHTLSFLF